MERGTRSMLLGTALVVGVAGGAAAQGSNAIGSAVPPRNLALIGVTQVGDISRAWLVNLDTNRREAAGVGGQAFGYVVKRVQGDRVVLSRSGREFVLRLGDRDVPVRETPVLPRPATVISPDLAPDPVIRGTLPVPPVEPAVPEPAPVRQPERVTPPEPAPAPMPYPGYGYPPEYGYGPGYGPGYPPVYDPYTGASPYAPYGYYGGAPLYPDGTPVFAAPYGYVSPGFYPGRMINPALPRWNPQTSRRRTGDFGAGSYNPQTQRRRGRQGSFYR